MSSNLAGSAKRLYDLDSGMSVSILSKRPSGSSRTVVLIALALSLGACSRDLMFEGNEYSNPVQVNRIKKLYMARDACLAKNAVPGDSTYGDAATVAKAVALACTPETDRLIVASNPDRDPKVAQSIRNDSEKRAVHYVMRAAAYGGNTSTASN